MKALAPLCLVAFTACVPKDADQRHDGWYSLRWAETPSPNGATKTARPEDCTKFEMVCSFDQQQAATFKARKDMLREGDVIAYWMKKREASEAVSRGELSKIGYGMLSYGHLAIVAQDPQAPGTLRLFSSQSFKGPNIEQDISSLADHSWDAYRLDKWDRVDQQRFYEFIDLSIQKAGKWYGYDFTGMFGLWNAGIEPTRAHEIGYDYICSTVVVAALHYAGLKLDAVNRDGVLDLISPKQVVTSSGCFVPIPDVEIQVVGHKR